MKTTQNNRLIAEFMGLPTEIFSSGNLNYGFEGVWYETEELSFNIDWNWLMEVVNKIEELGNDVLITTNYIQIAFDEGEKFIVIEDFNIKITSVYDACIEFINWYNLNKETNGDNIE